MASVAGIRAREGRHGPVRTRTSRTVSRRIEEQLTYLGRQLVLICEGPVERNRYEVLIRVLPDGRLLTRAPIRGRTLEDARDRAHEVVYTMVGIERLQETILAVAAELAPEATVELSEDAHAIRADLTGAWQLAAPLAVSRDVVADPAFDLDAVRVQIRAHFLAHLRATPGWQSGSSGT